MGNLGLPVNVCPAFAFNPIETEFNNPFGQCYEMDFARSYQEYENILSCLEEEGSDLTLCRMFSTLS